MPSNATPLPTHTGSGSWAGATVRAPSANPAATAMCPRMRTSAVAKATDARLHSIASEWKKRLSCKRLRLNPYFTLSGRRSRRGPTEPDRYTGADRGRKCRKSRRCFVLLVQEVLDRHVPPDIAVETIPAAE